MLCVSIPLRGKRIKTEDNRRAEEVHQEFPSPYGAKESKRLCRKTPQGQRNRVSIPLRGKESKQEVFISGDLVKTVSIPLRGKRIKTKFYPSNGTKSQDMFPSPYGAKESKP